MAPEEKKQKNFFGVLFLEPMRLSSLQRALVSWRGAVLRWHILTRRLGQEMAYNAGRDVWPHRIPSLTILILYRPNGVRRPNRLLFTWDPHRDSCPKSRPALPRSIVIYLGTVSGQLSRCGSQVNTNRSGQRGTGPIDCYLPGNRIGTAVPTRFPEQYCRSGRRRTAFGTAVSMRVPKQ